MREIISVDPFKCRLWRLHDRLASEVNEKTCQAEIESIMAHGQHVPVLGRRLTDNGAHQIELIYGARRLFAARHLNIPLLVEVRAMTDREGLVAMDIENRVRKDISPYERGLSYKHYLTSGMFESQEDLSKSLQVSASRVSRLLQLAKLPAVVVNAFRSPADIRENWGLELVAAIEDPTRRAATIRMARTLSNCTPRMQSRTVARKLLSFSALGRKPKQEAHDRVVMGSDGAPLFRIRYLHNSIALTFAAERLPEEAMQRVEIALSTLLRGISRPRRSQPEQRGATLFRAGMNTGEIAAVAALEP